MLFLTLLPINKCHRYAWKKLTPASIAPNSPQFSQFSSPASMNDGPGTLPTPAPNDRKSVILGHVYWIFKLSLHRATAPISRPIPPRDVGPPSWVWMRFSGANGRTESHYGCAVLGSEPPAPAELMKEIHTDTHTHSYHWKMVQWWWVETATRFHCNTAVNNKRGLMLFFGLPLRPGFVARVVPGTL